jgi:hypothetical protein
VSDRAHNANSLIFLRRQRWHARCFISFVTSTSTVTLILPHAQGVVSLRPAMAGMMVRQRVRGSVMFAPIDARLARAQLTAIQSIKVSR